MLYPTPHKTRLMPDRETTAPVIDLDDVKLTLGSKAAPVDILKGISLQIAPGKTVGVLGPSGAGKTSLLMVMAGLESVTSGQINLVGTQITNMEEDQLAALRRDKVGIVFQAFRLIPSMTALQNVAIPLELAGHPDADRAAAAALEDVGLGHRLTHFPDQMSGGEQQRVAIARALAPQPESCWQMNRPAIWTVRPATRSSISCLTTRKMPARHWSWSHMMLNSPADATGSSGLRTDISPTTAKNER